MPRPKGSKNKPKTVKATVDFAAQLAEKQSAKEAVAAEIASITANIDALKAGKEDLMNAAQKLFQKMYEQTAGAQGAGPQGAGPDMGGAGQSTSGPADDVVDGDYREV